MTNVSVDALALGAIGAEFLAFADAQCGPYAPTYDRLARAVATDPAAAVCVSKVRPGQQPPNVFLGAAHLLLGDAIRDLDGEGFLRWCHANQSRLAHECATRLVQTNEARRSSFLLPAIAYVAAADPARSLALVEVGASAGLLLALDRYRYEYRFMPDGTVAESAGDPDSPVLVSCDLRGSRIPPIELDAARLVGRVGIDLEPVLAGDGHAVEWLRALVWPDHPDRRARLDAALSLLAADPVPLIRGDALEVLPRVVGGFGADVTPVVFHHATLLHFEPSAVERFHHLVPRLAASRGGDLVWIVAEAGSSAVVNVEVIDFRTAAPGPVRVAEAQPHGAWLRWLAKER